MFPQILNNLHKSADIDLEGLIYYVDRHIEIDGEDHGPAAQNMLYHLCDNEPRRWRQVSEAAKKALSARIQFWDGIEKAIINHEKNSVSLSGKRDDAQATGPAFVLDGR